MAIEQFSQQSTAPPGFSFKAILPSVLCDMVLPLLLFGLLTHFHVSLLYALLLGGIPPALHTLYGWLKSGRMEPLGIVVVLFLVVGAVTSLLTGSVLIAEIKDSFLTATFGLICLGSLFAKRPLLFTITRQITAGDNLPRRKLWDARWSIPAFRQSQRLVTIVWGIAYLALAVLRVVLAFVLPPERVMMMSPLLGYGVLIALILWTKRYLHQIYVVHVRDVEIPQ